MHSRRSHNKSLHPISPVVPAFAWCSQGAANAGPPVETGELNRYAYDSLLPALAHNILSIA